MKRISAGKRTSRQAVLPLKFSREQYLRRCIIETMRYAPKDSHFSEATGKLHMRCPHRDKTGITVHVVIKEGHCYRSRQCMVLNCKFNILQADLQCLLSLTW